MLTFDICKCIISLLWDLQWLVHNMEAVAHEKWRIDLSQNP